MFYECMLEQLETEKFWDIKNTYLLIQFQVLGFHVNILKKENNE